MAGIVFGVATSLLLTGVALGIVVTYIEPRRRTGRPVNGWWYVSVLGMFVAALAVSAVTTIAGWTAGMA